MRKPIFTDIEIEIRRRIFQGEYPPGSRIPTWDDLQSEFGVSRATLRRTLDAPNQEGFLVSAGKLGTFVNDPLPFTNRYALVMHSNPTLNELSHSLRSLLSVVDNVEKKSGMTFIPYELSNSDSSPLEKLREDANHYRIEGIFLLWGTWSFDLINELSETGIKIVATGTPYKDTSKSIVEKDSMAIPRVLLNCWSFYQTALDIVKEIPNCEKIAVIANSSPHAFEMGTKLSQIGYSVNKHWLLAVGNQYDQAEHVTHLLFNQPQTPDAIIVMDDFLVENVQRGIEAACPSETQRPTVVTFQSYPSNTSLPDDIVKVGYSSEAILEAALKLLRSPKTSKRVQPPRITVDMIRH